MVGINSTRDDNGIQSLIRENNQSHETKAVSPTEATLRVRAIGERQPGAGEQGEQQQGRQAYRGPERRSGRDRRNDHRNILLDTRTNRERRRTFNQNDDTATDIPVRGIDIKI